MTVVTTHLEYFIDAKPIVIKLGKDINSIFESDHWVTDSLVSYGSNHKRK